MLKDLIPSELQSGFVGIFWHTDGKRLIVRKAVVTDESKNRLSPRDDYLFDCDPPRMIIEYDRLHKDVWEKEIIPQKPEWQGLGYNHFSRGRIIFDVAKGQFVVHMPLMCNDKLVEFLVGEFNLPNLEIRMGEYECMDDYCTPKDLEATLLPL